MELVTLDGYTEREKVTIARDHLLRRQLDRAGLSDSDVTLTDDAVRSMATEYTREAGVRDLERAIARVLRKVATEVALDEATLPVTVDAGNLRQFLGRPRHTPESAERTALPGVATGLAVTGVGGDVLFIEASLADPETGATGLTLTGQLGEVMQESARIGLSYLRSHGAELELPVGDLAARGVHLHVPAGAVPKDGPSAGITMTTALASLLSGRPVRADVAMTGELSLTGRVLPIGGVKQKLLAAHRAGITTVLIPARNEPDLDDVPADVLAELTVHPVGDVREVLRLALEPASATEATESGATHDPVPSARATKPGPAGRDVRPRCGERLAGRGGERAARSSRGRRSGRGRCAGRDMGHGRAAVRGTPAGSRRGRRRVEHVLPSGTGRVHDAPADPVRGRSATLGGGQAAAWEAAAGRTGQVTNSVSLQGKRALVTGAASGIGAACARALAKAGATVVGADLDERGATAVAEEIGGEAWAVDLTDTAALAESRLEVDVLVNNAGIQHVSPIEDFPPEMFHRILVLMLEAPFLLVRAALPHMYRNSFGRVINISSVHGLRASPFKSAYVSAKHGLEGLSKVVALEGAEHGVTSNCISPGYVRTPLVEKQIADQARVHGIAEQDVVTEVLLAESAIKELVEPDDVADLAVWLASPAARLATGATFTMDGGWSAR
jgi:3-hydroxybutyrate dehydrogenase